MIHVIAWLLAVDVIALATLPIAFRLFSRLPERGITLARPLGILLVGYPLWLLGSLGLVPHTRLTILGMIIVVGAVSLVLLRRHGQELREHLRREWRAIVIGEVLFLVFFLGWLAYRAYDPDLTTTEKPMDLAFLSANLRASSFPPEDPWLLGQPISYYYMGYYLWATLAKVTGIPSTIAYFLSLGLIAGMAATASYGLAYGLLRWVGARRTTAYVAALAAPALLLVAGNLVGGLELARAQGVGSPGFWSWVEIKGLSAPDGSVSRWVPTDTWWWWRSTRVIDTLRPGCDLSQLGPDCSLDYTISEFPFFSLLLGDLHPHLSSLPFLLLVVGLSLEALAGRRIRGARSLLQQPGWTLVAMVSVGALGFLNVWDLPTGVAIFAGAVLLAAYAVEPRRLGALLKRVALPLAIVATGAVILYLPQYLVMSSQVSGILPVDDIASRPLHLFLIWGLFLVILVPFAVAQLWEAVESGGWQRRDAALAAGITLAPVALWLLWQGVGGGSAGTMLGRLRDLLPWLLLLWAFLYGALARARRDTEAGMVAALLLSGLGVLLIIGPELFFVVDLFGTRMNTVFKLYFQAWTLLALGSSLGLYYVAWRRAAERRSSRALRQGWWAVVVLLALVATYYPAAALPSKAEGFRASPTVDGLEALARQVPDEVAAIRWLQRNAPRGATLVEAVGGDYSSFGRFAATTGVPTVLNWPGHEYQWRGSTAPFEGREDEVRRLYTTTDIAEARAILDKYGITYVIVGPREVATYGTDGVAKFERFLELAFQQGDVKIYRVQG